MKSSFLSLAAAGASVVGFVVLAAACSSSTSSTGGSTPDAATADTGAGDTGPAVTPTFTEIYTGIIATKCTPCHTTATGTGVTAGKLDMTSQAAAYTNLVGVKASGEACAANGSPRVVPDEPDNSVMYLKVSNDDPAPCGSKMPLGTQGLDAASSDLIKAWITAGAKND